MVSLICQEYKMKKNRFKAMLWNAIFIASGILISIVPAHALTFGDNIITNGGAEGGRAFPDGRLVKIKQWQAEGGFTAIKYSKNPAFVGLKSPGPKKRGKNYFAGGSYDVKNPSSNLPAKATKTINLSSIAKTIDKNSVLFKLSGYFGGWSSQDDNAILSAEFLDASAQPISQVSIGSVLAADRKLKTGLLPRNVKGAVPAGTRSIRLVLTMIYTYGNYNDGYADDLSMVLKKKR
jgi:hypothetical protein